MNQWTNKRETPFGAHITKRLQSICNIANNLKVCKIICHVDEAEEMREGVVLQEGKTDLWNATNLGGG